MDLTLSVDRQQGFLVKHREPLLDPAFRVLRKSVLERDGQRCRACGFTANTHMEVAPLDPDDAGSDDAARYCVLCPLCNASRHVGLKTHGAGEDDLIVYLPEISQANVSALCHAIFAVKESGGVWSTTATQMLMTLSARKDPVEQLFGADAFRAGSFGGMLRSLSDEHYARRKSIIGALRLLPMPQNYSNEIAAFTPVYQTLPNTRWEALSRQVAPELFAQST